MDDKLILRTTSRHFLSVLDTHFFNAFVEPYQSLPLELLQGFLTRFIKNPHLFGLRLMGTTFPNDPNNNGIHFLSCLNITKLSFEGCFLKDEDLSQVPSTLNTISLARCSTITVQALRYLKERTCDNIQNMLLEHLPGIVEDISPYLSAALTSFSLSCLDIRATLRIPVQIRVLTLVYLPNRTLLDLEPLTALSKLRVKNITGVASHGLVFPTNIRYLSIKYCYSASETYLPKLPLLDTLKITDCHGIHIPPLHDVTQMRKLVIRDSVASHSFVDLPLKHGGLRRIHLEGDIHIPFEEFIETLPPNLLDLGLGWYSSHKDDNDTFRSVSMSPLHRLTRLARLHINSLRINRNNTIVLPTTLRSLSVVLDNSTDFDDFYPVLPSSLWSLSFNASPPNRRTLNGSKLPSDLRMLSTHCQIEPGTLDLLPSRLSTAIVSIFHEESVNDITKIPKSVRVLVFHMRDRCQIDYSRIPPGVRSLSIYCRSGVAEDMSAQLHSIPPSLEYLSLFASPAIPYRYLLSIPETLEKLEYEPCEEENDEELSPNQVFELSARFQIRYYPSRW